MPAEPRGQAVGSTELEYPEMLAVVIPADVRSARLSPDPSASLTQSGHS